MRLAVNGWFAGQHTTGSGQYLDHLLQHLPRQRAGIEVDVFVPSTLYDPIWRYAWPDTTLIVVAAPSLPRTALKLWWEQIGFPRAARKRAANVLWVPYWAAPLWQPAPVVATVHDLIPLIIPEYRGGIQHRAYTWFVAQTARRSSAVLTVSHASADAIVRRLGIPAQRVHVVYHGPNVSSESAPSAEALETVRAKYGLPARYFLYLGGFDIRKNVDGVIRAYKRFLEMGGNEEHLVIAGAVPKSESTIVSDPHTVVSELDLADRVHFCGWVEEEDKPVLYALATAFVFPGLYEGFGMMVTEAMASGTPVITSSR